MNTTQYFVEMFYANRVHVQPATLDQSVDALKQCSRTNWDCSVVQVINGVPARVIKYTPAHMPRWKIDAEGAA